MSSVNVATGALGGRHDSTVRVGYYAVTVTRLPPRLRLPPHAHDMATLNVVLDGEYGEVIERGPLRSHGPATLIAKPAGTVHANHLGSSRVECLVIELNADTVLDVRVARSARVARYGGRLRTELARRDDMTPLVVEGLVLELLGEIARTPRHRPNTGDRRLGRVQDLLHEESGPRRLSELAGRVGLHPIYLARAFRVRFGCSVGEYARDLRIERARRLLHHPGLPLSVIAERSGYSDQSHMTRDFRITFDLSPGAYRRLSSRVP